MHQISIEFPFPSMQLSDLIQSFHLMVKSLLFLLYRFFFILAYNDSSNRNQHEKKKHGGIYTVKTLEAVKDEG